MSEPVQDVAISPSSAQIGPNAVLQLLYVLRDRFARSRGDDLVWALAEDTNTTHYLLSPPQSMSPLVDAVRLFAAVGQSFDLTTARAIFVEAGYRTADYIIANRIPRPAQILLRVLPQPLAIRVLARAIMANAWTFVGDGRLKVTYLIPLRLEIRGTSLQSPDGIWHLSVVQRLYQRLVSKSLNCVSISHNETLSAAQFCLLSRKGPASCGPEIAHAP